MATRRNRRFTRAVALADKTVCAAGAVVCGLLFAAGTVVCPLLLVLAFAAFCSDDMLAQYVAMKFVELAFAAALFTLGVAVLGDAFRRALRPDRVSLARRS